MAKASSFRSPASLTHRHNKAQRVRQSHEAVRRIEAGCRFVQRIDDHHGRAHRAGALERALQRVGKQDRAEAPALLLRGDRQPARRRITNLTRSPARGTLRPSDWTPPAQPGHKARQNPRRALSSPAPTAGDSGRRKAPRSPGWDLREAKQRGLGFGRPANGPRELTVSRMGRRLGLDPQERTRSSIHGEVGCCRVSVRASISDRDGGVLSSAPAHPLRVPREPKTQSDTDARNCSPAPALTLAQRRLSLRRTGARKNGRPLAS
jgi:hypothetical protein